TCLYFLSFSFYCSAPHRSLHSFPTRRSSDLSPMLSDETSGISATARCTRRRSYAFSGPMLCSTPEDLAFSARNFAICFSSLSLRSEEHTSELQSRGHLVCRLLLEKKKK